MNKTKLSLKGILLTWSCSLILWLLYRTFINFPELVDELFFKPLVFIGPVIFYLKQREKISLVALGFRAHNVGSIFIWGLGLGVLLTAENLFIWSAKEQYLDLRVSLITLIILACTSLGTALSEEILYRGFLLERLWKIIGQAQLANVIVAVLFTLGHIGIALFRFNYGGFQLMSYLLLIFLNGLANGIIYTKTRSLYATIISHSLWNFSNVLIH